MENADNFLWKNWKKISKKISFIRRLQAAGATFGSRTAHPSPRFHLNHSSWNAIGAVFTRRHTFRFSSGGSARSQGRAASPLNASVFFLKNEISGN